MNPFDQTHPSYPYNPSNHPIDWSLFPSDPTHLYHPDNVRNPYHPSNPNGIILVGGVVRNPENPYNPASIHNPHHPLNPLGPPDSPDHPYHPQNPGNHLLPPPVPQPPAETCEFDFNLTARSAPRSSEKNENRTTSEIHFQVMHGLLQTPLVDSMLEFKQQFLEYTPDLRSHTDDFKDKQTYGEEPHIPENEKLTLTVDNSDGVFVLPTGGLGSSGAPCLFDWDIWVDYHYVGRYVGNSGLRTQGIELNLRPESYQLGAGIKVTPKYVRMSREKEIDIPIQVEADGQWECLPFWAKFTDCGVFLSRNTGIYEDFLTVSGLMQFNGGTTTIAVTKNADAELPDRLLQGFIFYPKRKINGCAIELVLLDFCRADQDLEILHINQQTLDVQYPCIEPKFTLGNSSVKVHLDSNLTEQAICVLNAILEEMVSTPVSPPLFPVSIGTRAEAEDAPLTCGNFFTLSANQIRMGNRPESFTDIAREKLKCVPYMPEGTSKIIIRPHYKAARRYGWLRAFGFHPNSAESWNTSENKDKVLEAAMTITPSMFCDNSIDAGNYCLRYLFYGCRNLKLGSPFTFTREWDSVQTAGNDFMLKAFWGCEALDNFPVDYVEPQGFVTVGENFKAYKCYDCKSLYNIGTINTEPPHLVRVGYSFEAFEYAGCEKLLVLPERYRETSQLVSDQLYDFQMGKFAGCSKLRTLPDRYMETEVVTVGDNYLAYKFSESGLEFLPYYYSESLAITFIGKNCQVGKFTGCTRLRKLPVHYTEINPAHIENNFIKFKFKNTSALVMNAAYRFPNIGESVQQQGVFEETFAVTGGVPQSVNAEEIINGNVLPALPKKTFGDGFGDYEILDEHWKS